MNSNKDKLTKDLTEKEFKEYYFLKEELKDFCKKEGLKISGNKNQLEERIIYYLNTGKSLDESKAKKKTNQTKNTAKHENNSDMQEITLDSKLGDNFKCSEDKREFFEKEIGKRFKFKVKFQKWLKANPDKTYREAIDAYYDIQNSKEKTNIGNQFQYNQYIRDFFEDNKDKKLEDAIKCWNYKKSLKGHNKYKKSDLNILDQDLDY